MKLTITKILSSIALILVSAKSLADTQIAIFDDGVKSEWRMRTVDPVYTRRLTNLNGTDGFSRVGDINFRPIDFSKADCDSQVGNNLKFIAMLANKIEGGYLGSLPKEEVRTSELSDKDKITGDVIKVKSGQGTVLSENNCYAIVNTVFHNISKSEDRQVNGKTEQISTPVLLPMNLVNGKFNKIQRFEEEAALGKVIDVISLPNKGNTLEKSEESTLLLIKKPKCDSLPESEKLAGDRHHKIFDFNNPINYMLDITKDRSGDAGIYSVCKFDGKMTKQKGGIARIQISDNESGSNKQDLAILNTISRVGSSGCPMVYRDSQGIDHFMGNTVTGAGNQYPVNDENGLEIYESSKVLINLFSREIADELKKLRSNPKYFK